MSKTIAPSITLTAMMFGRTITTEHATIGQAWDRVLDIALAQTCRIEGNRDAGLFIPQVNVDGRRVDDPRAEVLGSYDLAAHA